MLIHSDPWIQLKMNDNHQEEPLWELFHENSKSSPFDTTLTEGQIQQRMASLDYSLHYINCDKIKLTAPSPMTMTLSDCITTRTSAQRTPAKTISMEQLANLLYYSYGTNKQNKHHRNIPSAGGLYPLEVYIATSSQLNQLEPGLYHYNSKGHFLSRLPQHEDLTSMAKSLTQYQTMRYSSMLIMITGVFERTIFKYKDRGYRYVLLEAGHLGQNLNLISTAMELNFTPLGGFDDRKIDSKLQIDGVNHSSVYMATIS